MEKYTLHSGGAIGADITFEEIGREYGMINFNHYWYGKKNPHSKTEDEISLEDFEEGVEMVNKANSILKRSGYERYMNLLARNWCQVKYSETVYAISTIKNNKVAGGTGWAASMAILEDKELYVFDQNKNQWYYWYNNEFVSCVVPKLTKNFAGIGSRKINKNGIAAIRKLFERTK